MSVGVIHLYCASNRIPEFLHSQNLGVRGQLVRLHVAAVLKLEFVCTTIRKFRLSDVDHPDRILNNATKQLASLHYHHLHLHLKVSILIFVICSCAVIYENYLYWLWICRGNCNLARQTHIYLYVGRLLQAKWDFTRAVNDRSYKVFDKDWRIVQCDSWFVYMTQSFITAAPK